MQARIERRELLLRTRRALQANPVVALVGPRQCGKTTLAREIAAGPKAAYFDLEDPVSVRRLAQPMTALEPLRGLIVIDEIQRDPSLVPLLRVLADRPQRPARFLILGSASPELTRASAESLAGRVAFIEMGGFDLEEVGEQASRRLWLRGGFPRSFLARSEALSASWREDFIRTFLERDVRILVEVRTPAAQLRRLWTMLAHYHGQVLNSSEIGRSLGESHPTVRRHLDVLVGTLMVRELQPWHENLAKRQVKSPKIYLRDSGILHSLLGIPDLAALHSHPRLGASWEGFVIEEAVRIVGERHAFFWATQAGAELDLLLLIGGKRYGVEVKYADAPGVTKSMHVAMTDLGLERLFVAYPGTQRYALDRNIEVLPVPALREALLRARAARAGRASRRRSATPKPPGRS
jgi:predicted AAA+ superfamily ATPase